MKKNKWGLCLVATAAITALGACGKKAEMEPGVTMEISASTADIDIPKEDLEHPMTKGAETEKDKSTAIYPMTENLAADGTVYTDTDTLQELPREQAQRKAQEISERHQDVPVRSFSADLVLELSGTIGSDDPSPISGKLSEIFDFDGTRSYQGIRGEIEFDGAVSNMDRDIFMIRDGDGHGKRYTKIGQDDWREGTLDYAHISQTYIPDRIRIEQGDILAVYRDPLTESYVYKMKADPGFLSIVINSFGEHIGLLEGLDYGKVGFYLTTGQNGAVAGFYADLKDATGLGDMDAMCLSCDLHKWNKEGDEWVDIVLW